MTMNLNARRIFGTVGSAAVLMGTGVLALAAPAGAQLARPVHVSVTAVATTTAFVLDGTYSDGGTARPQISDRDDTLTVDMSSQNRPTAKGWVVSATQIVVRFPDEAVHFGTLLASGWIVWDNGSAWQKLVTVPDVRGQKKAQAVATLQSAGFTVATPDFPTCDTPAGSVDHQNPAAPAAAVPGSQVTIYIAVKPTIHCM
jgi:hypothetical protein